MNNEINDKIESLIQSLEYNGVKCSTAWSVYDFNAHTIQELICQVFTKVNEIINIVNNYTNLIKAILDWIKKEGLEQAVKEELDRMVQDGTLAEIINEKIFSDLNTKIDNINTSLGNKIEEVEQNINDNVMPEIEENKEKTLENEKKIEELINTKDTTSFYILDNTVTYGDMILIHADDGTWSMIDTGWEEDYLGFLKQLDKLGVKKLKYLFITHDHSDHIGNAVRIIEKYRPEKLVCKGGIDYDRLPSVEIEWQTKEYHERMIQACNEFGVEVIYAKDSDEYLIGKTDTIKPYNSTFYDYVDFNGMSITYVLKSNGTYSCFTGDSNANAENNIINVIPQCDFLKLSHHGGVGGNQIEWIKKVNPKFGFVNRIITRNAGFSYLMEQNATKVLLAGGEVYTNDNNYFGCFKVGQGHLYPACNSYKIPLSFVQDTNKKYRMTNTAGQIAGSGIFNKNGILYLVKDADGYLADDKDKWVSFGGYRYYANSDNSLKTNTWIQDEETKDYYWLDEIGRWVYWSAMVHDKNETYIINSHGVMVHDAIIDYNGNHYYCQPNGAILVDNWYETSGGYVYANAQGHLVNGRYFINGRWYTFENYICTNPNNGEAPDYITQ